MNQVLQKDPENVSYRDERAELLGHLGKLLYMLGGQRGLEGLRAAEAPLRQSLAIDDVLMVENPRVREYQRRFAQNSLYFSGVLFVADRLLEREQALGRVDGILQNLDPRSPEERLDVAVLHKLYGDLMHATARPDEGAGVTIVPSRFLVRCPASRSPVRAIASRSLGYSGGWASSLFAGQISPKRRRDTTPGRCRSGIGTSPR